VINGWIAVIKAIHTIIFLLLLICVLDVTQAGIRGKFGRRSHLALGAIAVEGAIFSLNGRKCPLTELVEDMGAEKGQVSDIFLPDILAKNIFTISMSLLGISALAAALRKLVFKHQ
jgi:hypothetical protein